MATKATEKDLPFALQAEKEPSDLHKLFAEYIRENSGYEDVDLKTVQLAVVLHPAFQRSDENKARQAGRAEAKAAARAEIEKRKQERAEQAKTRKAPAKKTSTAKAATTAKPRRRPAAKPDTSADEEF